MATIKLVKLSELKVVELRSELEECELDTTGNKTQLQERLRAAILEEGRDPDTPTFETSRGSADLDCLHLQLYRDSKDRYKQGQTKASLSLQHFLGVYSGFTLDKESNTIAIICQDVTVVLAFDTRERLIQWQVKIANNLGEDEQFLVQISSAPTRGKVPPGPARLHVQEHRFCLTVGVPPRLVGHWQIRQLRKFGLVENKFCFEGGSSCGKGEGLYVLVTDQGENISRAFHMAAEGRLAVRRRPLARNMSVMTSPRRSIHSRMDPRVSDLSCVDWDSSCRQSAVTVSGRCGCSRSHDDLLAWPSAELWSGSQRCEFADTSSTVDYTEKVGRSLWRNKDDREVERCSSCIGKLGVLSRSSTLTNTPAWSVDNYDRRQRTCGSVSIASNYDRTTISSLDYWTPHSSSPPSLVDRLRGSCVPGRPLAVKPAVHQPLPSHSPYSNYDVPKPATSKPVHPSQLSERCGASFKMPSVQCSADENYDTPRSIRELLPESTANGDVCHCCGKPKHQHYNTSASVVVQDEDVGRGLPLCPCQRVMCWAGGWMRLPYLLSGAFRTHKHLTNTTIHKVKLDGEGKMPFVNCRGENYTCETSNSCKMNTALTEENENEETDGLSHNHNTKVSRSHYANVNGFIENVPERSEIIVKEPKPTLAYENLEFAKSLEYYENSRLLMQKTDLCKPKQVIGKVEENENSADGKQPSCTKCGHSWNKMSPKPSPSNGDYLIMGPALTRPPQRLRSQPSSPLQSPVHEQISQEYLPMLPISNKLEELQHLRIRQLNEKSQSTPSFPLPKHTSLNAPPHQGSTLYHCISETNSPYTRRRLMTSASTTAPDIRKDLLSPSIRKRSSSMDSSRNLENLEIIQEKVVSPTRTIVNTPSMSNATSIDSLSDLSLNQRPIPTSSSEHGLSRVNDPQFLQCKSKLKIRTENSNEKLPVESNMENPPNSPLNQIKRSASIPCKSVYNRDSSSSNDSGVSTGSLQFQRREMMELDFQSSRKRYIQERLKIVKECNAGNVCVFRKSKSEDPFDEMGFDFQDIKVPVKSSSAGATVPVCTVKTESKGFLSPAGVPYIDSHSTSSGTSDMSDYIETLSLSSYTSSDTPDSFQLSHTAVSTLRPRSGKEYLSVGKITITPQVNPSSSSKSDATAVKDE